MKLMLMIFFLISCEAHMKRDDKVLSKECCAYQDSRGNCYEELIPGCSEKSAPLFRDQFFAPDDCCERRDPNSGVCYKELVPGCSTKGNGPN